MSKERISILGAGGMLGQALTTGLAGANRQVRGFTRQTCDVTDGRALAAIFDDADVVINCAAWTDVDGAESSRAKTYLTNALAVEQMAALAIARGTYFVQISTDYVFDGRGTHSWREDDLCSPLNVYGRSKLLAERFIQETNPQALIARIQWTYGPSGDNCVTRMMRWLSTRDQVMMVDDQIGSPTPVAFVASALATLIDLRTTGICHVAPRGYCSRYDLAVQLGRLMNLDTLVLPCDSTEFPTPARRPLNTRLNCSHYDNLTGATRPHWLALLKNTFDAQQSMGVKL